MTWAWSALLLRTVTSLLWHGYRQVFIDVSPFAKYVILLSLLDFLHTLSLPPHRALVPRPSAEVSSH